jgi:hypothetical protein
LKERGVPYERWRQQAARGKGLRFKAPDMAGRMQSVFSFYSQHGFDSTNGAHLFTEKTAILHAAQMELFTVEPWKTALHERWHRGDTQVHQAHWVG